MRTKAIAKLDSMSAEELNLAISGCSSWTEVAEKLFRTRSMRPLIAAKARKLGLETDQLEKRAREKINRSIVESKKKASREEFSSHTLPLLFRADSPFDGKKARKLISRWNPEFKWLEYRCQICHNPGVHEDRPLTLQIDHKNGDSFDHRIENLRYLCPNCHSQTETFTGRNIKVKKIRANSRTRTDISRVEV